MIRTRYISQRFIHGPATRGRHVELATRLQHDVTWEYLQFIFIVIPSGSTQLGHIIDFYLVIYGIYLGSDG